MTDARKALHDQVEQTREEEIDSLADFIKRFLHPSASSTSQRVVFEPLPPGSNTAAEIEQRRQHALAQHKASQMEMIARSLGSTRTRLGIDLNKMAEGLRSWSASRDNAEFMCSWIEGRVLNRLSMFHLTKERVVTFERFEVSATRKELLYKIRILTPNADSERALTVPV